MMAMIWRRTAISFAIVAVAAAVSIAAARADNSNVDPVAVQTLKRMTDFVSSLDRFSVHSENTLEDQLDSGQRVDIDVGVNVLVRRPNKIHTERTGELVNQDFYYDGETLTLYVPSDRVYATLPAPATIEELLDFVREELTLVFSDIRPRIP